MKPHPDRIRWNERYRSEGPESVGRNPSAWLISHKELLKQQPKGPALDLACGNGRNSRYLAGLGFSVEAVDISDVAIAYLDECVASSQLSINSQVQNLENAQLPQARYQVILNINFLERSIFAGIQSALSPGGLLFFKTFIRESNSLHDDSTKANYALDHNELPRIFSNLQVIEYFEETVFVERRGKKRTMASLVARM